MADLSQAVKLWSGGRPADAEREINAILRASPEDPQALRFLAEILGATGRAAQSIAIWRKLSALTPRDAGLLRQLAQVLLAQGALAEAVENLRAAIVLEPHNARAYNNLGLAQLRSGDPAGAAESLEQAVQVDPNYALAYMNLGLAREQLRQSGAARAAYERALHIDPHLSQARARLSEVLRASDEAAARRERHRALESHAINLMTVRRHDDAVAVWKQLIDEGSDLSYVTGTRFHCQLHCCDWSEYDQMPARLEADVLAGRRVDLPFSFFVHSSSPAAQLACSRAFVADRYPSPAQAPPGRAPLGRAPPDRPSPDRASPHHAPPIPRSPDHTPASLPSPRTARPIRVAYLSSDFHEHATAYLLADLLERHDRARFEIIALSYGLNDGSAMRSRLERAVDRFVDVSHRSDDEVAALTRELDVDIAVDLKGFTGGGRTGIFARRAAPVQVNFLGYPGTMGADYIDYIIADRHVIPEADQLHYSEKVIYLPGCYQPNDPARPLPSAADARARRELGLPDAGFVFCCFNNLYKITPAIFGLWMNLLKQIGRSVLWLLEGTPTAMRNLRGAASASGVDPNRLVFAPHISLAAHLARYRHADLFLDTTPCNAHTTASDSLWMGVPVLTLTGTTFAGRVASSLLNAVDLPQLCTKSLQDYSALALRLATAPEELRQLKGHLEHRRHSCALFDSAAYCRDLENAYERITARHAPQTTPATDHGQ